MHEDRIQQVIDKIVEIYGENNIYDPEYHPKLFAHQIMMAKRELAEAIVEKAEEEIDAENNSKSV